MDERVGVIYALTEPDEPWNIRYIGCTRTRPGRSPEAAVRERVRHHYTKILGYAQRMDRRTAWLVQLRERGLRPGHFLVTTVPLEDRRHAEAVYMHLCVEAGFDLLNEHRPWFTRPRSWP
jgi:hypothetical protein